MRFGFCASLEQAAAIKQAGWDFVEENVQGLLQGQLSADEWKGMQRVRASALPVVAANCLVPGALKITGPAVDVEKLRGYMQNVLERAGAAGMKVLVFGSAGARNVPEGFDRETARRQIVDFLKLSAPMAARSGVTIVVEPLNRKESNILNSVEEAMGYVRAVNHANIQCLVDSYHFWLEDEPLENLRKAMPWIKHVHMADKDGRVCPGDSGTSDYRPFFRVLKDGGYDGALSVEAIGIKDLPAAAARVLPFLKRQWEES